MTEVESPRGFQYNHKSLLPLRVYDVDTSAHDIVKVIITCRQTSLRVYLRLGDGHLTPVVFGVTMRRASALRNFSQAEVKCALCVAAYESYKRKLPSSLSPSSFCSLREKFRVLFTNSYLKCLARHEMLSMDKN